MKNLNTYPRDIRYKGVYMTVYTPTKSGTPICSRLKYKKTKIVDGNYIWGSAEHTNIVTYTGYDNINEIYEAALEYHKECKEKVRKSKTKIKVDRYGNWYQA